MSHLWSLWHSLFCSYCPSKMCKAFLVQELNMVCGPSWANPKAKARGPCFITLSSLHIVWKRAAELWILGEEVLGSSQASALASAPFPNIQWPPPSSFMFLLGKQGLYGNRWYNNSEHSGCPWQALATWASRNLTPSWETSVYNAFLRPQNSSKGDLALKFISSLSGVLFVRV